jgi:hypothetical protein
MKTCDNLIVPQQLPSVCQAVFTHRLCLNIALAEVVNLELSATDSFAANAYLYKGRQEP